MAVSHGLQTCGPLVLSADQVLSITISNIFSYGIPVCVCGGGWGVRVEVSLNFAHYIG